MTDILLILFLNSLVICGIKLTTEESMIFHSINRINLPDMIRRPLYGCVTCMASIWSLPFFIYFEYPLEYWPAYALALAAINTGLYGFISRISEP